MSNYTIEVYKVKEAGFSASKPIEAHLTDYQQGDNRNEYDGRSRKSTNDVE